MTRIMGLITIPPPFWILHLNLLLGAIRSAITSKTKFLDPETASLTTQPQFQVEQEMEFQVDRDQRTEKRVSRTGPSFHSSRSP